MAQIIIKVKGNFNVDKISTQTQKKPQKEPQKEAQTQTQTQKMGLAKKNFQVLKNKINAAVTGEGPTTPPTATNKTKKTWLFIALAVGGVLLLTSGKKKKKN